MSKFIVLGIAILIVVIPLVLIRIHMVRYFNQKAKELEKGNYD